MYSHCGQIHALLAIINAVVEIRIIWIQNSWPPYSFVLFITVHKSAQSLRWAFKDTTIVNRRCWPTLYKLVKFLRSESFDWAMRFICNFLTHRHQQKDSSRSSCLWWFPFAEREGDTRGAFGAAYQGLWLWLWLWLWQKTIRFCY